MARAPLVIGPFARGLNTYDDPTAVLDDELVEALNFDPGLEGSLKSRPPFQNLNKPLTLGSTGSPRLLGFFYDTDGTYYLIASDGLSSTYHYRNGTWTLITNTFAASAMVQFDGKAWLVSPVGEADPGGYWTPSGLFVADAAMPHGDVIVSYKFRLWIAPGFGSPNGTRVYYSKVLGQANFWTSPGFVDIGAGDGQGIVALTTYYNSLIVFRTQSIYSYEYITDPAQGAVQVLVPGVGLTSKDTLVSHENYLYFMYDEKAYEFINNRATQINIKVPFEAVNLTGISYPFTVSEFNNRIIFGYYDTMYVFSLRTRTWTRWRSTVYGAIGQILSPQAPGAVDQAFVLPTKTVAPEDVYRNLGHNTFPVNSGNADDWATRFSFTQNFNGTECVFTCPSTQDSVGRGWDVRGNMDLASPGTTGQWNTIPVVAGQRVVFRVRVKSTKALSISVQARIHNGAGAWSAAPTASASTVLTAGVYSDIVYDFTAASSGFIVFSVRAATGVTMVSGDTISGQALIIQTGSLIWPTYFDGGTYPVGSNVDYYTSYEGTPNASETRLTVYRKASLLYISDETATVAEAFQCILQTKNYSYKLSSNFKRLYWWGVDAIFRQRVIGQATPVVFNRKPTWGEIRTNGITWHDLLSSTWGNLNAGSLDVISDYDLEGLGSVRKFVKFRKGLRFRQIYFKLTFDTDGSIATAPVQVFTLSAYIDSKETVSKTVS